MTHHVVNGSADAFGKTAKIQRRRNAPVSHRKIIHDPVNLLRRHSFSDIFCHFIQHGGIQFASFPDPGNLFRRFDHLACGYFLPCQLMQPDLVFYFFVAIFIRFAAAAPAYCFTHCYLQNFNVCFLQSFLENQQNPKFNRAHYYK